MTGASAHRVTAIVLVFLVVIVVVSVLVAIPTFHQALGIGSTDALDEGVLMPRMSTSIANGAPVYGVLALAFLVAVSTARMPHAAKVAPTSPRALSRSCAVQRRRSRIRRSACATDDADHHYTSIVTTPALRSALHSAQPEGFSVCTLRTAPYGEEGYPAQRHK